MRVLRRVVVLAVVAVVVITLGTAARVWWTARQDDRPRSDAVVVLGASQYDGRPSRIFSARLGHALELYREDVSGHVVTVGGSLPGDRFTEGGAGKRWLVERGVPAGRVHAIGAGSNTLHSLRLVDGLYERQGWKTAVIVTDPWHSLRARTMARDLGMDAETSPSRSGPAVHTRETQVRYIARETLAYLYYKVFGGSSEWGPNAI